MFTPPTFNSQVEWNALVAAAAPADLSRRRRRRRLPSARFRNAKQASAARAGAAAVLLCVRRWERHFAGVKRCLEIEIG